MRFGGGEVGARPFLLLGWQAYRYLDNFAYSKREAFLKDYLEKGAELEEGFVSEVMAITTKFAGSLEESNRSIPKKAQWQARPAQRFR